MNATETQEELQQEQEKEIQGQAQEGAQEATEQKAEEQAAAPEPTPEEVAAAEAEKVKKEERRRTFQTRIDQLTRSKREAEERAEFYRQKYEEIARPPQREQFASDEDFEAERTRRLYRAEAVAVTAQSEHAVGSQAAVEMFRERVAEFSQDHPDWQEHVSKLVTTPHMDAAIVDSPKGAEISYYLAKHPGEAARIARLSPQAQDREIVRLESRELFEQPKPQPVKSSAPAPIKPIPAAAKAPASGDDEFTKWVAERNAKNRYGA